MFPVIMVLSALVFFSPEWPRRVLARFARRSRVSRRNVRLAGPSSARSAPLWSRAGYALAATYCLLQLLLPLRFIAYGGDVRWHEQGMRFSWRVMVREKNGSVTFRVRDRSTDRSWYVSPRSLSDWSADARDVEPARSHLAVRSLSARRVRASRFGASRGSRRSLRVAQRASDGAAHRPVRRLGAHRGRARVGQLGARRTERTTTFAPHKRQRSVFVEF
jgi:hypothetical protein